MNVWKLCDVAQKGEKRMYIITATYQGKRIVRRAYSDLQVFTIVNQLYRDGCTDVGMREVIRIGEDEKRNNSGRSRRD